MKRLKVIVPSNVQKQILEQVLYIAQHSIENALAWEDRVRAAMEGLADAPGHAIDAQATSRVGISLRKLVFEQTYLIHYHLNDADATIGIVNFRHGSRLPRRGEP